MNQEIPGPDDDTLNRVLWEWKVETSLPPRFHEQVWRRIEHGEERESMGALLWRRVSSAFARPRLAVSYVTVLLAAGLAAGYWQARVTHARTEVSMGTRYVQMMDPYQRSRR